MSKIIRGLMGIALVIAFLVVALLVAPLFLPTDKLKATLAQKTSTSLGHLVTLDGPLSIRLFPTARLDVQDVTIARVSEQESPPLLTVSEAHVSINILALLAGKVDITQFVLIEPKIFLMEQDTPFTSLAPPASPVPSAPSTPLTPSPPQATDSSAPLPVRDIALGNVTIKNGQITYHPNADAGSITAKNVNVRLQLKSLDTPLLLTGDLMLQGKPATLKVDLSTPQAFLERQAGQVTIHLSVAENTFHTVINLANGHEDYTGNIRINAPTLRDVSTMLGIPLPTQPGLESLAIGGIVSGTPATLTFTDATMQLDQISGSGGLRIDWREERPIIIAEMDFDLLDLRPYLPAPTSNKIEPAREKSTIPPWSDETIDLSILKMIDMTLVGTTRSLHMHDLVIDNGDLSVVVADGELIATLTDLQLYGGTGSGQFALNAKNNVPDMRLDFDLTALDTNAFATDFLNFSRFSGMGNLSVTLESRGKSQAAFIANLNGNGRFDVVDGTITGVDFEYLGGSLVDLVAGFQETGKVQPDALLHTLATAQGDNTQTPFSALNASFNATMGVITSNDIIIEAPYISLHGRGNIDLPDQNIDMTLLPTVQKTASDATDGNVAVPIRIRGHFNDVQISIDTQSILKSGVRKKARKLLKDNGIDVSDEENLKEVVKEKLFQKLFGD